MFFSGESEIKVSSLGAASQSKLVPGLKPYTWYSFQVQGATMEGDAILWGNWSETVEIRTQQAGIEIKSFRYIMKQQRCRLDCEVA